QIPPVMKAGHKIDNFEISKVLCSGTRSHIYAAKQMLTNKQYILKVPSLNFRDDLVYLEGFIREQWVGRRLEHKGVMRIYAPIEDSPFLYHICEPVQGQTLRDWRIDHPNPTVDEVRDLLGSIIPALRAFHRMGMVHRDIKPENIMISHQGEVKIIDFGTIQVAGMEEIHSAIPEEHILGSVNYSAPEYVLGQKATPQSDLFSLGCVIYELLCGRRPFADTNPNLVNKAHSYGSWSYQAANAVRADIPMWIDEALKKACAPNPAHRYGLLSEFMADFTSPGQDARRREFKAPLIERNPIAFWKGLSAFLTILIAVLWVVIMKNVS
ncbi:MAG: serine/threonine protein kinase, partial [Robiginitomaculum sp.]|nr:serine/threonine protein kinase [Robiginitomaculum sp.]